MKTERMVRLAGSIAAWVSARGARGGDASASSILS